LVLLDLIASRHTTHSFHVSLSYVVLDSSANTHPHNFRPDFIFAWPTAMQFKGRTVGPNKQPSSVTIKRSTNRPASGTPLTFAFLLCLVEVRPAVNEDRWSP
jgi:hypothetical protein